MIYVLFILSCVLCNTLGKNVTEDSKYFQYSIKASGGGVVKPSENLNLTYNIGEENKNWSKCIWYKHQPGETNHTYCTFLSKNNSVQMDICDGSISSRVKYVGTTKAECKIQINVTVDDDATWASRIFDESSMKDPPIKEINITVFTPITTVKSNVTKITTQAGNKTTITCSVTSGAPIPEVKFTNDLVSNETSIRKNTFTFVPKIEDNGRQINCTATQYNKTAGSSEILSTKTISIPITVTFIPTMEINITVLTPIKIAKSNVTKITTQAGNKTILTCSVTSGAPIPVVKFTNDLVSNETSISRNTFTFVPKIEDNGRKITCTATQYNKTAGSSKILSTKTISIPINVTFIPQPQQAQNITIETNEAYNISLTFKANPTPTNIFWFINRKGMDDTKNASNLIKNLTTSKTDNSQYTIQLNFSKSEEKQGTNQNNLGDYYLLIENDVGQTKYYFNLKTTEDSSSGWVKAVVIILVIAIIIGILVCYKKYYQPKKRQDKLRSHLDFNNPLSYETVP